MVLDATGIIILILFFIKGYSRGLIFAAFSLIAVLLGIILALRFSQELATWMLAKGWVSSGWSLALSYILLFTVVVIVARLLAKLLRKALELMMLGIVDRIAGGIVFVCLGAILWSTMLWMGGRMHVITHEMIASSKTYGLLSQVAPYVFGFVGHLLPFAKDIFGNMQLFFDRINQFHVDTH